MSGDLILVVEDDEKSRRLARDVLDYEGFRVAEASAGDVGVRLVRELLPALVVMDIQLPGLDGIAALHLIREDPTTRHIPVIAVTASAMPRDRIEIGAAGFDSYLRKPIDVAEFVALVRRLLAARVRRGEGA